MNSAMKRKLIIATLIIVVVVIGVLAFVGAGGVAKTLSVSQAVAGEAGSGKVQVSGKVVDDSYTYEGNTLCFTIGDDSGSSNATLPVRYDGSVSATFGNGVTAICTGKVVDGVLVASEMVTKCPSKYESAEGALTVESLLEQSSAMVGKTAKVAGYIKTGTLQPAGSAARFTLYSQGKEIAVHFDGALPDGIGEESSVVVTGSLGSDGTFTATDVASEKVG